MGAVHPESRDDVERLRARIVELERELVEQAERTGRVVAAAQQRTYWLDRWQLDLDRLMRRRGVATALDATFRVAGKLRRGLRRLACGGGAAR